MDITELTVHELQEKIKSKELTITEITKAYVDRIKEKEPEVQAFITELTEAGMKQAEEIQAKIDKGEEVGKLAGIPIGIKEYKFIVPCMNTDKICIFTNLGVMHQIKVLDIPAGKFRDKGVPIDNLCNYDSTKEYIIQVLDAESMIHSSLLFATAKSMLKVMDGELLNAAKRTVQATKLSEDELIEVIPIDWMEGSEDKVVLQTKEGVFLKFLLSEIPKKKKSALGVRGMKLSKDDSLTNIYVMAAQNISSIVYKEKELEFHRLKLSKRDSKGTKVRR